MNWQELVLCVFNFCLDCGRCSDPAPGIGVIGCFLGIFLKASFAVELIFNVAASVAGLAHSFAAEEGKLYFHTSLEGSKFYCYCSCFDRRLKCGQLRGYLCAFLCSGKRCCLS